jgi:hypothetical protein
MPMPEQLVKNAVSGAGSATGQVLTAKVLETLLGDAKISKPAQDAIQTMQQHFFSDGTLPDFITPLRRTGIFMGKDPFKKVETCAYLGNKIHMSLRRLPVLTNMNLKEAATLLWDLHCQIALHIMHRRSNSFERSDADHSYVLMYLQESISTVLEHLCNKPDLTDEDVVQLKNKIALGIIESFHNYIQNTQAEQSSGARRTAIDHNVRETMEKVCQALERFTTEKPLRTSIDSLQQTAQAFYHVLKQMLLAVVLVQRQEGEKQQDAAWVLQRKIVLAKTTQSKHETMESYLQEEKSMSTGYQGKSGVLYINPFANRVQQLVAEGAPAQDKAYFHYLMNVFAIVAKTDNEQTEYELKATAELFHAAYTQLHSSETFLLKDILQEENSELAFIHTALLLYRQSNELARFMAALQHFMQLVGKLGLYNNPALHTQLTHLIQAASTGIEQNLTHMHGFVKQGSEARVGGWLNPIDEMLQQIKRLGNSITRELQSFQGHFAKIIDPLAMQMEFNQSKVALLRAALGLGHASQIDTSQMDAITQQISNTSFEQFVQPLLTPHLETDTSTRMTEILTLVQEMQQLLDTAQTDVSQSKAQYDTTRLELDRVKEEMKRHERTLKADGARLQTQAIELTEHMKQAEAKLEEIDKVVHAFGHKVQQQLNDLNADSSKDVSEANQLMEAARATLASSSSQALSEQMTLLSRLKGRLEERQKSYQKLVESVTSFQDEYILKRGAVSISFTNVQDVAREIDRTVLGLVAKINALTEIISCLRQTLEEKDKQLAMQNTKLLELEAQLTALRVGSNTVTPTPQHQSSDSPSSTELFLHPMSKPNRLAHLSFMQSINKNQPLTPEYRIQRAIEIYETDIMHGQFVRNKERKIVKYAIWCELNHIVFLNGAIHGELNDAKDLIMAAIQQVKMTGFSIKARTDIYVFNDIVRGKSNDDIYLEFLKGKDTLNALKHLERSFLHYVQQRNHLICRDVSLPNSIPSTRRYSEHSTDTQLEP